MASHKGRRLSAEQELALFRDLSDICNEESDTELDDSLSESESLDNARSDARFRQVVEIKGTLCHFRYYFSIVPITKNSSKF